MWRPYPEQINAARRAYHDWWQALEYLRDGLQNVELLREVDVTGVMPKCQPWERNQP
jgi:thiazole synthase ThiGH ThiG subunit